MSNLVRLPGSSATVGVNAELVEMLEEMLARAKRGEIVGAAWVEVTADAGFCTLWKNGGGNNMVLPAGVGKLFCEFVGGLQ